MGGVSTTINTCLHTEISRYEEWNYLLTLPTCRLGDGGPSSARSLFPLRQILLAFFGGRGGGSVPATCTSISDFCAPPQTSISCHRHLLRNREANCFFLVALRPTRSILADIDLMLAQQSILRALLGGFFFFLNSSNSETDVTMLSVCGLFFRPKRITRHPSGS